MVKQTYNLIAIGDVQICPKSYGLVDDFLNQTLLGHIRRVNADALVIPGDLFEFQNYTNNNYISAASVIHPYSKLFDTLGREGVRVVIVDGNHDKTCGMFNNANDIFVGRHIIHASTSIVTYDDGPVSYILVPWLMSHEYTSKADVLTTITELSDNARARQKVPIMVGHIRTIGAIEKDYAIKDSTSSFTFSKDDIEKTGLVYGILGDIHGHQTVVNSVDYIGCIRQRHFGEAGNPTMIRHMEISYDMINDPSVITDEYHEIADMPQYYVLKAENEIELVELLDTTIFEPQHEYRIEIDFDSQLRSPSRNVHIRSLHSKTLSAKTQYRHSKDKAITPDGLIDLFNKYSKAYTPTELKKVQQFYEDNRPK